MGLGLGRGRGRGRGKGGFSGFSCIKFFFFGFNVIFWLLGCAILGVGIWLQISKGSFADIAPSFHFLSATALCITAGSIVLIVGFFGCCGAIMENPCMLLTYFLLVVIIFMMQIFAGIMGFVFRNEVESLLKKELKVGIEEKYNDTNQSGLKEAWDKVQRTLSCCGIDNHTNWYENHVWSKKKRNWVPDSCCVHEIKGCGQNQANVAIHQKACFEEIKEWIKSNFYIVGVLSITIGVLQVFGLIAAMILFCCIRNAKYYSHPLER